ncbi:(d)CMP kinase [bacterium]|nr:(d)CMP kinase [bacterium]
MIIAIDGPAGSGKSTIAKLLAKKLNTEYIDSGAIYRTITLFGIQTFAEGCEGNESRIFELLKDNPETIKISYEDHTQIMWLNNENVSQKIRDPKVTVQVKYIADHQNCRELVNQSIRKTAEKYSVVIDGRDIGTIVFPKTPYKFYLDAKPVIRAERRAKEYSIPLDSPGFEQLVKSINTRDKEDKERKIAPLRKASDALLIDTSGLDIEGVLKEILPHIQPLKS